ncbi:TolB family protein [Vallitalea okinawensis]|uniref:TolB family protein n=1 Tax=Vallitalea okinawensis TaxID=2078660 RepID=UPI000CFBC601|nr:hypothetical protein [Vallitalea okinawensis]
MKNLTLVPIYKGQESTVMGYNGTCPESPDGKRLCYAKIKDLSKDNKPVNLEIWICDVDLENHMKVTDVLINQHNGADTSWVDNDHIIFQEISNEGISQFSVMNVHSKEVMYGPVAASLGHQAEKSKIPFAVKEQHIKHNSDHSNIDEPGIYQLDMKTMKIEKLVPIGEIFDFIRQKGYTPIDDSSVSHVQLNPSADKVMIRLVLEECKVIVTKDLSKNEHFIIPNKPLHQLWFDDNTIIAVNKNDKSDRKIYQYDLTGNQIRLLAGKGNHIDLSPDKKWYVSDNFYHEAPVEVNLYRCHEIKPIAVLDSSDYTTPVWEGRAHANPVFSRDGKRVYFVHPVNDHKVEVVYADISELS